MPTLAAYPGMMQRARKREGLRVCRAAWLIGVSVREYREIEAGERIPSLSTYERIFEFLRVAANVRGGIEGHDEDHRRCSAAGTRYRARCQLDRDVFVWA